MYMPLHEMKVIYQGCHCFSDSLIDFLTAAEFLSKTVNVFEVLNTYILYGLAGKTAPEDNEGGRGRSLSRKIKAFF